MIKWLVLKLLAFLQESLDPDLKERVRVAREKAAALDAEHERLLREIAESERLNAELYGQRVLNAIERGKLEDAIKEAKTEAATKQAEIDALSARDRVRVDL